MFFKRGPRERVMLERAMEQVESLLRDMQRQGKDLTHLKFKKYQKTHYTSCTCEKCLEARRTKDPHKRGILEDGYKVFLGPGDSKEDAE